jgi:hypothetical protein
MFGRHSRSLACCALAGLGLGCLDAGPTPLGRHLVAGRAPEQVQLVEGPVGAPSRILLLRAQNEGGAFGFTTEELTAVDDPGPGGGPAATRVIVDHIGGVIGHCVSANCPTPIDSRGRLYVFRATFTSSTESPGATVEQDNLIRVDPATGDQHDFGSAQIAIASTDRARVAFEPQLPAPAGATPTPQAPLVVVDLDDTQTMLSGNEPQFADDDLYYVTDDRRLWRLPSASRVPEALVDDVDFFTVFSTARGPLLPLTTIADPMTDALRSSLFDAKTLTRIPLPPQTAMARTFAPSPDGRFIATQGATTEDVTAPDLSSATLTMFDRDTSQEIVATEPFTIVSLTWRPRHDEAWFLAAGDDLFRWQTGGQPEDVGQGASPGGFPQASTSAQQLLLSGQPIFTPDGQFRLVVEGFQSDRQPVDLQSADDATAPFFRLNQPGTGIGGIWPLGDGRMIVEDWLTDIERNDIYVVDPVARTQRAIASTGNVVATGRDRCLALLHWVASGSSGDLTSVDYATGAATLIAENVHAVAVDASGDPDDALAPGTRVAFLVRNRIPSPYDGLWVIDLP